MYLIDQKDKRTKTRKHTLTSKFDICHNIDTKLVIKLGTVSKRPFYPATKQNNVRR